MATFKAAINVASINFHRWKRDYRIWFIFIFIAFMVHMYIEGLLAWAKLEGYTVNICVLTSLFVNANIAIRAPKTVFHIGMLVLLCDAPFFHPVTPYASLRSRRTGWWLGECMYIIGTAFIYMAFMTIVSMLLTLPIAEFGNEWGTAENALVYGTDTKTVEEVLDSLPTDLGTIVVQGSAVKYLYPYGTLFYTFITGWATFSVLGLIVYCVSLVKKNIAWGMSVAGFFIFLEPIANWNAIRYPFLQAFTPVCWNTVSMLDIMDPRCFLSIPLITVLYIVLFVILLGISWFLSKKKTIELR